MHLAGPRAEHASASRSPTRAGASIHSGQPETSRSPHSSTTPRSRSRVATRQPAERVAVEVDPLRSAITNRSRNAGQRIGARRARRPRRASEPLDHRRQQREPGSRCSMWPSSSTTRARSRRRPRGGRRELARDVDRHVLVARAVHEQQRHADRQRAPRRRRLVAVADLVRRAAEELVAPRRRRCRGAPARRRSSAPACETAASSEPRRAAAHTARCPPAEWPMATVRAAVDGQRRGSPRDVVEVCRPAAAVAEPPVLDVPHRPAARHEVARRAGARARARSAAARSRRGRARPRGPTPPSDSSQTWDGCVPVAMQ